MDLKLIPFEDANSGFTTRKIRKTGDTRILESTEKLLAKFIHESDEMLISELDELIIALHRSALQVQRAKKTKMITKLKKSTRTNIKHD